MREEGGNPVSGNYMKYIATPHHAIESIQRRTCEGLGRLGYVCPPRNEHERYWRARLRRAQQRFRVRPQPRARGRPEEAVEAAQALLPDARRDGRGRGGGRGASRRPHGGRVLDAPPFLPRPGAPARETKISLVHVLR